MLNSKARKESRATRRQGPGAMNDRVEHSLLQTHLNCDMNKKYLACIKPLRFEGCLLNNSYSDIETIHPIF